MSNPPYGPNDRPIVSEPSWRGILAVYAAMAAVPAAIWLVSSPFLGAGILAAAGTLYVGGGRVRHCARCVSECGGCAVDLADVVRITVSKPGAETAC